MVGCLVILQRTLCVKFCFHRPTHPALKRAIEMIKKGCKYNRLWNCNSNSSNSQIFHQRSKLKKKKKKKDTLLFTFSRYLNYLLTHFLPSRMKPQYYSHPQLSPIDLNSTTQCTVTIIRFRTKR